MQAGLGRIVKLSNESAEMEPGLQKAWHGVRDTVNVSHNFLESKSNVQEWVHHNFTFHLWLMTVRVTPSSENILKSILLSCSSAYLMTEYLWAGLLNSQLNEITGKTTTRTQKPRDEPGMVCLF